jgi:hypothetical protein
MTSELELRVARVGDDRTLFQGRGRNACLEIQGELSQILDA